MNKVRRKEEQNYDVLVILMRFCDSEFKENYVATIGVDFKVKTIQIENKRIKLQIWDTAGQERFKNITQTYYKGAVGIILAYSVTDETSFDNIEKWMHQISENTSPDVKKILVGNKSDLKQDRKVSYEAGVKLADSYSIPFF
jgi:small GTP-binding protein